MNGRPDGPSPALLAAQRRLEEARRSYQRSADSYQPRATSYELNAAGGQWSADRGQQTVVSDQSSVACGQNLLAVDGLQSSSDILQRPAPDRRPQIPGHQALVALHPSLALAMLGQGMTAAGRIWLLLRHLDRDGRGWLELDRAQRQLCDKESDLRVCGRRQLRHLLRQGQGVFWRRDKSRIWLRSASRVAIALEVDRLRGRPVALPLGVLLAGIGQVRAHFYAAFHSGRPGDKQDGRGGPINRVTLRKITHVPARTQRLYEQRAGVQVQANMAVGERLMDKNLQERAWQHGRATFRFIDTKGKHGPAGGRYVAWRLPNSYSGPHALSPKGRMKKINHQIDLVNSRVQGNDLGRSGDRLVVDRLFHPDGQSAGRAYNRDQTKDLYWPSNRRRRRRQQLWRILPGKGR